MGFIRCPKCSAEISDFSQVCPACHADLAVPPTPPPHAPGANPNDEFWKNFQRYNPQYKTLGTWGDFGRFLKWCLWLALAGFACAVIAALLGHDFGDAVLEASIVVVFGIFLIVFGYVIYAFFFTD